MSNESPSADRSSEVRALVDEAAALLRQATEVHGNADESWRVAHLVKRKAKPPVFPDDFFDDGAAE